jgi:hypothetical protein
MAISRNMSLNGTGNGGLESSEFSANAFIQLAYRQLGDISAAHRAMVDTHELLREVADIEPLECDEAIDSIQALQEPVQMLCGLLEKSDHLPSSILPQRYPLLVLLYYVDDISCQLKPALDTFRTVCRNPSQETNQQRREIHQRVGLLLSACEDIEPKSKFLLEWVRPPQERSLLS